MCYFSVAQWCPTLWTHGLASFTTSWNLLKLMSIESVMPSNYLILCCPLLLPPSIFPSIRGFSNESALASGGQSIGASASASASVLPMTIQGWFPLWLTGLISLLSKGLSSTTVQKHQLSLLLWSNWHPYMTTGNHSFDWMDLCQQSDISAF